MRREDRAPAWTFWVPAALYAAAIFALSSTSNPPGAGLGSDKLGHLLLYGGLAACVIYALTGGRLRHLSPGRALAAVLISTLYAVTDELHQAFVPGRSADAWDLLADAGGAALVAVVALLIESLRRRWGTMTR